MGGASTKLHGMPCSVETMDMIEQVSFLLHGTAPDPSLSKQTTQDVLYCCHMQVSATATILPVQLGLCRYIHFLPMQVCSAAEKLAAARCKKHSLEVYNQVTTLRVSSACLVHPADSTAAVVSAHG